MLFNIFILVSIFLVIAFWPSKRVQFNRQFNANDIGRDLEEYLRLSEDREKYLKSWARKKIIWYNKRQRKKTPISIVYVHGFSASLGEIRPVPDLLANKLKANLYFSRLAGHGSRDPLALGACSGGDWYADVEEALEIGYRIGDQVLVIATSLGAALVSEYLSKRGPDNRILGAVFISPCFGIPGWKVQLFRYPVWAKFLFPLFFGKLRVVTSQTEEASKWWSQVYPVLAIENLLLSVEKIWKSNFKCIKSPSLIIFSYKDPWISINRIQEIPKKWGGGSTLKPIHVKKNPEEDNSHVILGDVKSPKETANGVGIILEWVYSHYKLAEDNSKKKHDKTKKRYK